MVPKGAYEDVGLRYVDNCENENPSSYCEGTPVSIAISSRLVKGEIGTSCIRRSTVGDQLREIERAKRAKNISSCIVPGKEEDDQGPENAAEVKMQSIIRGQKVTCQQQIRTP